MVRRWLSLSDGLFVLWGVVLLIVIFGCAGTYSSQETSSRFFDLNLAPLSPDPSKLAYTTDSELSPHEIFLWAAVFVSPLDEAGRHYYMVAENPLIRSPVAHPIKYVLCVVNIDKGRLVAYAYYIDSVLELYELQEDDETLDSGHYAWIGAIPDNKRKWINYFLLKVLKMERT